MAACITTLNNLSPFPRPVQLFAYYYLLQKIVTQFPSLSAHKRRQSLQKHKAIDDANVERSADNTII